nr:hypothetical protein CFP56_25809 [Quercus suber]
MIDYDYKGKFRNGPHAWLDVSTLVLLASSKARQSYRRHNIRASPSPACFSHSLAFLGARTASRVLVKKSRNRGFFTTALQLNVYTTGPSRPKAKSRRLRRQYFHLTRANARLIYPRGCEEPPGLRFNADPESPGPS